MDKQTLKQYLKEHKTYREISELEDVSKSTVRYYVNKFNLNHLVTNYKPEVYNLEKIDTPEKAYTIGFICGDAAFTETEMLDLAVAIEDREILEFISDEIGGVIKDTLKHDAKKRIFPKSRLQVKIPKIFTFIKERLKKGRNLPIVSHTLNPNLIQGFFDAEGCITWGYRKDRGRLWQKVSFTSSYSLLEALQKILLKYDITTAIKPKSGEDCFVMEFTNELDVFKFFKILPADNFFLKRKRENYLEWVEAVKIKYSFSVGDVVKFADKRTLNKYNVSHSVLHKGEFEILEIRDNVCLLSNGSKVNQLLLTKKGISNYALRLELDEFGGTTKSTIPSQALDHSKEGVETTGGKMGSLNNQLERPSSNE